MITRYSENEKIKCFEITEDGLSKVTGSIYYLNKKEKCFYVITAIKKPNYFVYETKLQVDKVIVNEIIDFESTN